MNYKDYYKELGIGKNATPAEIKKAYRVLAKKYHPDKTKGNKAAEDKFKDINEANEVLSDPVKRAKYDQFGADWKHYEETGAKPGGFDWSKYGGAGGRETHQANAGGSQASYRDEDIDDLFEMLFGQRSGHPSRGQGAVAKGDDLNAEAILSLEEAYHGTTRLIKVNSQTIKVIIKPGVADGQILRIQGKGGRSPRGGSNGDIYLTIKVASDPEFQRHGNDLHCNLPVDLYTALLGGKTPIKTFKGKITIHIPKGTPNGKELSLRGVGMPAYGRKNEFGDLIVRADIVLPEQLSEKEVEMFKTLAKLRK